MQAAVERVDKDPGRVLLRLCITPENEEEQQLCRSRIHWHRRTQNFVPITMSVSDLDAAIPMEGWVLYGHSWCLRQDGDSYIAEQEFSDESSIARTLSWRIHQESNALRILHVWNALVHEAEYQELLAQSG